MLPLFAPKQTFARIDFLRSGGRLCAKRALIKLKFMPKKRTKIGGWSKTKPANRGSLCAKNSVYRLVVSF